MKECSGMIRNVLYLYMVCVTQIYTFVKIHQIVHLRFVHFNVYKHYLKTYKLMNEKC